ncbi:MAG TPA: Ig-like domain-containing protein [Gammaproteobacteria bacterium]|nr:Ig-like domain-containing protein [Gammaproteobacteria bacterium]
MEGSNGARLLVRALTGCAAFVACALAASCGSGNGYGSGGGGVGGGGTLTATFSSIQENVFTPICATCHAGASAPHGLRLDGNNSYALLVGVPSDEEPSILRVKPNDPDASYLVQKIQGTAASGERMPAGMPPLPQATIDTIRQWITNGATNDTLTSGAAIRVSSLSPLPDSTMTTLPASITVAFDREVNATTVDATTLKLVRSGGDAVFDNGNDVAISAASVTVPAANTHSAVMSLAGVASANDTYRITLSGSGAVKILDLSGNALDGEYTGTFPSGNGTAGGDFVAVFTVGTVQATLQSIQDNVLTPICSGCHSGVGTSLPGTMNLSSVTASRAALVSVASVEKPGVQRVAPSDSAGSYIVQKLQGDPGIAGSRMPFGGPFLDQPTINVIRQWIDAGAP